MKFNSKKEKWAWFGGLIDGEGCLSLVYHPKKPYRKNPYWDIRLTIVNTSEKLMQFLKENFKGNWYRANRNFKIQDGRNPKIWKQMYQWVETGKDLVKLLHKVSPYLLEKSEQANLLVRASKLNQNDLLLKTIHNKMKELNKRGIN